MTRFFFDVTDIVQYAEANRRVSGIQRVQARLIGSLARRMGGERIRACFWHPIQNELVHFDPSAVFDEAEFDTVRFRARLGLLEGFFFPSQKELRRALAPLRGKRIRRALRKAEIYVVAVINRPRFKKMGFSPAWDYRSEPRQELIPIRQMEATDIYVFLGSNWSHQEVQEFGMRHSESGGSVVQMIYDLIPYLGAEYCIASHIVQFESFLTRVTTYANQFICISEWTKKELVEFLESRGINRLVKTVPLAHEFDGFSRNETSIQPESKVVAALHGKEFLLCVGTLERRKNGAALLRAWAELVKRRERVPLLVFAGKPGWDFGVFNELLEANPLLQQKVVVISSPSDRDLAFMYRASQFSIYPSLYEGWGLPVGEAAWFGKYVIASNATSLPEVCGDLIDYVDPNDTGDIVAKIEYALDNPDYVARKEKMIRSSKLRTWDEVADSLLNVIDPT